MVIRNGSMKVKAPHPTSKVAKVKAPVTRRARLAKVKGPAQGGGWVAKVKSPLSFVGGSLRRVLPIAENLLARARVERLTQNRAVACSAAQPQRFSPTLSRRSGPPNSPGGR